MSLSVLRFPTMARHPISIPASDWGDQPLQLPLWLVEIGDEVNAGDALAELSAPGLIGDLTAPVGGRVVALEAASDRYWVAGEIVGWIEDDVDPSETEAAS